MEEIIRMWVIPIIAGIIVAILAGYIFKGLGDVWKENRNSRIVLVVFLAFLAIGTTIAVLREKGIPLSLKEKEEIRQVAFAQVGLLRLSPLTNHIKVLDKVRPFITKIEKNKSYEKETPDLVAAIYRCYAGAVLLSQREGNIADYIKEILPYVEKSIKLDPAREEIDRLKASVRSFKEMEKEGSIDAKKYFESILTIAMVGAKEQEVAKKAENYFGAVKKVAESTYMEDYKYFMSYGSKKLNMRTLLLTAGMLFKAKGFKVEGPTPVPLNNGYTLIKYSASHPKSYYNCEWEVSKAKGEIIPKNATAEEMYNSAKKAFNEAK